MPLTQNPNSLKQLSLRYPSRRRKVDKWGYGSSHTCRHINKIQYDEVVTQGSNFMLKILRKVQHGNTFICTNCYSKLSKLTYCIWAKIASLLQYYAPQSTPSRYIIHTIMNQSSILPAGQKIVFQRGSLMYNINPNNGQVLFIYNYI